MVYTWPSFEAQLMSGYSLECSNHNQNLVRQDVWTAKRAGDPDAGMATDLSVLIKTCFCGN